VSHYIPYKSDTKVLTAGSTFEFADFVPPRGPSGGRNVVDQFIIVVTGTITVGTALWDGRDVPRIFSNVTLTQRDGRARWNLSGMKTRQAEIYYNGIDRHEEHANVAIGAAQAVDLRMVIPMAKRFTKRPKDFALPADVFEKFTLNVNSLGGMATGTTVLSAMTLNCYVLAHYHEEHSVEFKSEDLVKSVDFNSNTEGRFAFNGAVHDFFVLKDDSTVGGGASIAAVTDARIEELGTPTLTRQDLAHDYKMKREITVSGFAATPGTARFLEPVQEGKCLPVIASDSQTSVWDGKVVPTFVMKLGVGLAGLSGVSREVCDKSQSVYNQTVAEFGITTTPRVKTEGKTRRELSAGWDRRQQLVAPWSAPLR
jgi:hypothetical protein